MLAGAGLATGLIGVAKTAISSALTFDKAWGQVITITDLSESQLASLREEMIAVSGEVGIAANSVVPALYQALSAGIPPDNVIAFLLTAGQAARGGVVELETAVNGLTAVVVGFGVENITAEQAADLLFTTVALGKTTFGELAVALPNVIAVAANLGLEFAEVAAIMAVLTQQTGRTAESTTQFRQLLLEASTTTSKLAMSINNLSGKSLEDLIKEGVPLVNILQGVRDVTEASGQRFGDLFGSAEALQAALLILTDDGDKTRAALDAMSTSTGATEDAFRVMDDLVSGQVDRSLAEVNTKLTELGTVACLW